MTTQREIAERLGLPIHPPKTEIFDLERKTNTDSKQRVRPVDIYRTEPFGLFMARPTPNHPHVSYIQSWLLPELGLRITDWEWKPGHERLQDFYVDITDIERGPSQWRATDHYLDIVIWNGHSAKVIDVDEFLIAVRADLLGNDTAQRAMEITYRTLDGVAAHGYDLTAWLREKGIELQWLD